MKREEVKEVLSQWQDWTFENAPFITSENRDELHQKFLNENYPEPLANGMWAKHEKGAIVKITDFDEERGFGFSSKNEWLGRDVWTFKAHPSEWKPIPKEEVDEALLNYARNKGYKNGNYKCISNIPAYNVIDEFFVGSKGDIWHGEKGSCGNYNQVFDAQTGKWAEIIEPKVIEPLLSYDITECSGSNKNAYCVVNIEIYNNECSGENMVIVKFKSRFRANDTHVISGDSKLLPLFKKPNACFEIKVKK